MPSHMHNIQFTTQPCKTTHIKSSCCYIAGCIELMLSILFYGGQKIIQLYIISYLET